MSKEEKKVDEAVTAVSGEWEFDREVADSFDSHVRKSIPFYDEIQRMVSEMSEYFVADGAVVYDLGCSTGTTLKTLYEVHSGKPGVQFIGVDVASGMIEKARKKLDRDNVTFLNRDLMELTFSEQPDFVTCLYTLQFLLLDQRKTLLQRVYDQLRGGRSHCNYGKNIR